MDAWTVTFVLVVVIVAVGAQAVVGFGFALIAMPLLVLVLDVRVALVLATLISLTNTSVLAYTHRQHVPWPTVGPMLAGAGAGMPFGLALLLLAPPDVIRLLVGVSTVVMAVALLRGVRFQSRSTLSEVGVGGLSGALSTSTGINGPPVVLYLQGREHPPREFRGGMAAFFVGSSVMALVSYAVTGVLSQEAFVLFVVSVPAIVVASWAGHQVADRVEPEVFRRLVFALLFALAAFAMAAAIVGLVN
jgi:uncharacterized membrane protein YfcA